jgi:hypothetical protein
MHTLQGNTVQGHWLSVQKICAAKGINCVSATARVPGTSSNWLAHFKHSEAYVGKRKEVNRPTLG